MSTTSESIAKRVINGIDGVEASAHDGLHTGANGARQFTKASSRWAAKQEAAAVRKTRMLKRNLDKQTQQLTKVAGKSVDAVIETAKRSVATGERYVKRNPWRAVAITSAAALVMGALLGRRGR